MSDIKKAVGAVGVLFIAIVVYGLIVGSILSSSAFSSLTIVNATALQATFAAFVVAATALITVGGTILGVLWILPYIKPLFDKKGGLGGMSA